MTIPMTTSYRRYLTAEMNVNSKNNRRNEERMSGQFFNCCLNDIPSLPKNTTKP